MANLVGLGAMRGDASWNVALNALDWSIKQPDIESRNYRWKYFSLVNEPDNVIETDQNGAEYNAKDKYKDVQERIKKLVDITVNDIGQISSIDYVRGMVKQQLVDLRDRSIRDEANLLSEITGEPDAKVAYLDLADRTYPGISGNQPSTVRLWTYLTLFGTTDSYQDIDWKSVDDRTCFSLFVGSSDFYKLFIIKESTCITKILEELNSYMILQKSTQVPLRRIMEQYFNQIMDTIATTFVNDKQTVELYADAVVGVIRDSMKKNKNNYINVKFDSNDFTYRIDNSKGAGFNVIKDDYESFLTNLIPQLNELVKRMNQNSIIQQPLFLELTATINNTQGKTFWITGGGNRILNTQPTVDKEQYKSGELTIPLAHAIIQNVIDQMIYALKDMEGGNFTKKGGKKYSIDCLSLGEIDFGDQNNYISCLNKAIKYCREHFSSELAQRKQRNPSLWKEFYALKNNAFFSGLYGEIIGLVNFANLTRFKKDGDSDLIRNYNTKLTGSTKAHINGYGLGGSVNDLIFSKDIYTLGKENRKKRSYVRYGVNIKHYITKKSSMFKLYGRGGKSGVFTSYTAKYLNSYQLNLVRFILANSHFFVQNANRQLGIEDIIMNVAINAIPQYLRISDRARDSANNLFFQINNVIYPTSYIYQCALDSLDYLVNRTNNQDSFMSVEIPLNEDGTDNLDEETTYKNLANARRFWKEKNYRLATSGKPKGKNAKIITRGLGINLVNFSL